MINIKITLNGKEYKTFDDAIDAAVFNGITDVIRTRLQPLAQEIRDNNIQLELKATSREKYQILWSSDNEALNEKMKAALNN